MIDQKPLKSHEVSDSTCFFAMVLPFFSPANQQQQHQVSFGHGEFYRNCAAFLVVRLQEIDGSLERIFGSSTSFSLGLVGQPRLLRRVRSAYH